MLIPPETCCCVRGQHVHQTVVGVEDTQPSYQERLLDNVTPPECDIKIIQINIGELKQSILGSVSPMKYAQRAEREFESKFKI